MDAADLKTAGKKTKNAAKYVTQFDSCTSMMYALGGVLKQKPFIGARVVPDGFEFATCLLNNLPLKMRQGIYRWSGGWCALDPKKLKDIDAEEISDWVVNEYPAGRTYPAVMIGSSNGAMTHLAAALGIPWLPQTFLVAVRREMPPDDIESDIEWGRPAAKLVRERNPELKMNQMHDPVQDRLMVAKMAYFRMKRFRLGKIYEDFIRRALEPGGTIYIVDNTLPWPMITAGDEHTFQIGGLGALTPQEYLEGSPRVSEFLEAHGITSQKSWPLPGRIFRAPESEWGYDPRLDEDLEKLSRSGGYRLRRITFEEPEDASPFVADLYRWWYGKNGQKADVLFSECFALMDPWCVLETGSVPFWLAFNTEPSLRAVHAYLDGRPFEDIYMMLMSNGVEGIGQVTIDEWKGVLARARRRSGFLGVNESKYPMDFASFVKYHEDIKAKMRGCSRKASRPLTLDELGAFYAVSEDRYKLHIS